MFSQHDRHSHEPFHWPTLTQQFFYFCEYMGRLQAARTTTGLPRRQSDTNWVKAAADGTGAARDQALREVEQLQDEMEASEIEVEAARGQAATAKEKRAREEGRRQQAEGEADRLRAELATAQERSRH